jgi:hypothetical protein
VATHSVQHSSDKGGLSCTFADASPSGDSYRNTGREMLQVRNLGPIPVTAVVAAQHPCSQGELHDETLLVAAGATVFAGPFPPQFYNDQHGNVHITCSTTVLPPPPQPNAGSAPVGLWEAKTAWVAVTYVNAAGESAPSAVSQSVALQAGSELTVKSPDAIGVAPRAVTGWRAYIGVGQAAPELECMHRCVGAPTPIGHELRMPRPVDKGPGPPKSSSATCVQLAVIAP